MTSGEYEKFQQRVFDELNELEEVDRQQTIESFVELGRRYGIDVIAEILDKGKSVSETFAAIEQKKTASSGESVGAAGSLEIREA